jgi:hypothetical protein
MKTQNKITGYICDYKELKTGTKTVFILKRVFIPNRLVLLYIRSSAYEACKLWLKNTIPTKTILQAVGSCTRYDYKEITQLERKI